MRYALNIPENFTDPAWRPEPVGSKIDDPVLVRDTVSSSIALALPVHDVHGLLRPSENRFNLWMLSR